MRNKEKGEELQKNRKNDRNKEIKQEKKKERIVEKRKQQNRCTNKKELITQR